MSQHMATLASPAFPGRQGSYVPLAKRTLAPPDHGRSNREALPPEPCRVPRSQQLSHAYSGFVLEPLKWSGVLHDTSHYIFWPQ